MSLQLNGTVALVTGANRGIGRALVDELLEKGASKVYAAARRPESLIDLVAAWGERVVPLQLDVNEPQQVMAAAAAAPDLQLLVNNAGIVSHGFAPFSDPAYLEASRREFETNVVGTWSLTQALAPTLALNGGGAVVNVISVAGLVNFPLLPSYSLSKAAMHSLTQATRFGLAGQGTKVHGVYPGPVDTDLASDLEMDKASPEHVAKEILAGLEAGDEEIFPDAMAKGLGAAWFEAPKEIERQVAAMVSAG